MQSIIDDIAKQMVQASDKGQVASYIPQLACVDANQFAIIMTVQESLPLEWDCRVKVV